MTLSRPSKWLLGLAMLVGLAFVYVPLGIVVVNSFNTSRLFAWPPPGFTTEWWSAAFANEGVRSAFVTSIMRVQQICMAWIDDVLAPFERSAVCCPGSDVSTGRTCV